MVPSSKEGVRGEVQQDARSWLKGASAGRLFTDTRAFTLLHICWRTSTGAALSVYPVAPGLELLCLTLSYWTNSKLVTLFTDSAVFLEGAGGNKPHYIAVCIGTALLSTERERPWLQSCLAACHCEVLPSVRAQIPPVQTGAPTQVASCVKNVWTSPSPLLVSSSLSLYLLSAPVSVSVVLVKELEKRWNSHYVTKSCSGARLWWQSQGGTH